MKSLTQAMFVTVHKEEVMSVHSNHVGIEYPQRSIHVLLVQID